MNKIKDPWLKLQGLAKETTNISRNNDGSANSGGCGPERKNQLLLSGVGECVTQHSVWQMLNLQ